MPEKIRGKKILDVTERFSLMFQYNLWRDFKEMVELWMVGHLNLKMLGVFPDVICQIILTTIYAAVSAWKGKSEATRKKQCLIVSIIMISSLLPLTFTKNNARSNSEMILVVWTWLTYSNSFMRSIPRVRGFIRRIHRDSSLGYLTSTRIWLTCCSARMGKFIKNNGGEFGRSCYSQ